MKRKSKRDWLTAGLDALVQNGPAGLSIDRLAEKIGVTKGSFYHHFSCHREYQRQLLALWEEIDTHVIIEAIGAAPKSSNRVDGLLRILTSRSAATANPEMALRAWALQDKTVRAHVRRIDAYRRTILQDTFVEMTGDKKQATLIADILYALLVGSYSIQPPIEKERLKKLYEEIKRLYRLA